MRLIARLVGSCTLAACLSPAYGQTAPLPAIASPPGMIGFTLSQAVAENALEARLDTLIDPRDLTSWLERMSSAPNHVSSPHDRENAEWELGLFKKWGWDAKIETFQVLYPLPLSESLDLLGPNPFKARLWEPPIPGDRTSDLPGQLPPYVDYQGDGDVTASLIYVNFGMPEDYALLERLGISVKGRIVIARYGGGLRGVKVKLAQAHGAVGCLIYSDPAQDGYAVNDVYPKGPARNADGVQRGSVGDITLYPGDPLTPGEASVPGTVRKYTRATAPTIMQIPSLPISYGDALPLLAALGGPVAPPSARGALPITYHIGPSGALVHLMVKSSWQQVTIYDVIATLRGSEAPDQWVLRGNHRDGWVFGARDPLAGQVALMGEAKAIGELAKQGFKPKRTLVYTSWDGEEAALLGSTEWAEAHAHDLQSKALIYINSDATEHGPLSVDGSQALTELVDEVTSGVTDPETGASLRDRKRAVIAMAGLDGNTAQKLTAQRIAAGAKLPLGALGSGSDYTAFLDHLGIASLHLQFGGGSAGDGSYHSTYDSFDHYSRFGDPGEAYGVVLAKTGARLVLRAANADIIPMHFTETAAAFAEYLSDLQRLLDNRRERRAQVAALSQAHAFQLSAGPVPVAVTPVDPPVEALDFKPLKVAVEQLTAAAAAYDKAEALPAHAMDPAKLARVNAALAGMEQKLLDPHGLPGRPWYKNLAYAPGVLTGYETKTFPGVREAIESGRYVEAQRYIGLTAGAITAYAAELSRATAMLQ